MSALYSSALVPANVMTMLSGHNHVFEFTRFSTNHPPQFITGNGGDRLDQPFPVPFPSNQQPAPGVVVADLVSANRFGFMTMDRTDRGWLIRVWDAHGALMSTCTLVDRQASCTPINASAVVR
jgi:hypothetical protein